MHNANGHDARSAYRRLALEVGLEFVVMFLVMYAMIADTEDLYLNLNNVYMTLMMVSPMVILMLAFMRSMYPSSRTNLGVAAGAFVVFILSFVGMRTQAGIGDKELLKAMIPHHSGAVLMCQKSSLTDSEVVALCVDIVKAQEREIAQMRAILARL